MKRINNNNDDDNDEDNIDAGDQFGSKASKKKKVWITDAWLLNLDIFTYTFILLNKLLIKSGLYNTIK